MNFDGGNDNLGILILNELKCLRNDLNNEIKQLCDQLKVLTVCKCQKTRDPIVLNQSSSLLSNNTRIETPNIFLPFDELENKIKSIVFVDSCELDQFPCNSETFVETNEDLYSKVMTTPEQHDSHVSEELPTFGESYKVKDCEFPNNKQSEIFNVECDINNRLFVSNNNESSRLDFVPEQQPTIKTLSQNLISDSSTNVDGYTNFTERKQASLCKTLTNSQKINAVIVSDKHHPDSNHAKLARKCVSQSSNAEMNSFSVDVVSNNSKQSHVNLCDSECPINERTHEKLLCSTVSKQIIKETHIGEKQLNCSTNDKCFTLKRSLKLNMLSHTDKTSLTCSLCKKRFTSSRLFEIHMLMHSGEKPFCCLLCNKRFRRKSGLEYHKITHTGEKPFSCLLCGKMFSLKSNLSRHIRIHTGEKPFSCSKCNTRFSDKSNMLKHFRIHTGKKTSEKPFSCSKCSKRFCFKSALVRHKLTHTAEKPFSCFLCNKQFKSKNGLDYHKINHTSEKTV